MYIKMTHYTKTICCNCDEAIEDGYIFCKKCITRLVKICTCDKKFIVDHPKIVNIGNDKYRTVSDMPENPPDFFFTPLTDNIYHILGCRGCKCREMELSIQNNFEKAVQASIVSCVYQKVNDKYEYLSDSLDEVFEDYLEKNGVKIGEPCEIKLT